MTIKKNEGPVPSANQMTEPITDATEVTSSKSLYHKRLCSSLGLSPEDVSLDPLVFDLLHLFTIPDHGSTVGRVKRILSETLSPDHAPIYVDILENMSTAVQRFGLEATKEVYVQALRSLAAEQTADNCAFHHVNGGAK